MSNRIIADVSRGSFDDLAKASAQVKQWGIPGIKFRYIIPEEAGEPDSEGFIEAKRLSLSFDQYVLLLKEVKGATIYFDVFGEASYSKVLELKNKYGYAIEGLKLQAGKSLDFNFIEKVCAAFNVLFLSINGLTAVEISKLIIFLEQKGLKQRVVLTYGIRNSSSDLSKLKINKLTELKANFDIKICLNYYFDEDGDTAKEIIACAFANGYDYVEEHVVSGANSFLNISEKDIKQAQEKPGQFSALSTGNVLKLDEYEINYRNKNKDVLAYTVDIPIGGILDADKIKLVQPVSPYPEFYLNLDKVANKRLKRSVKKSQLVSANDLDLMAYGLIFVRASSERLPGKCYLKIGEDESLRFIIKRLKESRRINQLIVCTTTSENDDLIEKIAMEENLKCVRSVENVFKRTHDVFEKCGSPDLFLRLTADNPFVDTGHIDNAIDAFYEGNYDYYKHAKVIDGCDFEIIDTDYFRSLSRYYAIGEKDSEYMTLFLKSSFARVLPSLEYKVNVNYLDYRFTLDYPEDLENIRNVFALLKNNLHFSYAELCNALLNNPTVYHLFQPVDKAFSINIIKKNSF